jgi:hypothetical protein
MEFQTTISPLEATWPDTGHTKIITRTHTLQPRHTNTMPPITTMMSPSTSTINPPKILELGIPICKGETVSDQDQVMDIIKLLTLSNNSLCLIITSVDPLVGLRDRMSPLSYLRQN